MPIAAGVVATAATAERCQELAGGLSDLKLVPLVYIREEEVVPLIIRSQERLDVLVFSGTLSHQIGLPAIRPGLPHVLLQYGHADLLKALTLAARTGYDISRVSVDSIQPHVVAETYAELGLETESVLSQDFISETRAEPVAEFHRQLWLTGRTTVAVTCRSSVYRLLKAAGVPVVVLFPMASTIRAVLRSALLEGMSRRHMASQVGVGILRLELPTSSGPWLEADDATLKLSLSFHQFLIDYGRRLGATIEPLGLGEFLLFTTRGAIEEATDHWRSIPVLLELRQTLHTGASLGFGLGRSALAARERARVALEHAVAAGGDCAFMVGEDGERVGPLGKGTSLSYSARSDDPSLLNLAHAAATSVTTMNRLYALLDHLGRRSLTAEEVAHGTGVSARSARRLLLQLCKAGAARVVGEERNFSKGRPRQIFELSELQ